MSFWESITVALEGLLANKMRAALTMLGVVIGVAAVITMLSLARGSRERMMSQIQQMGTNVLFVMGGRSRSGAVRGGSGSSQTLTLDDVDAIAAECPSVLAAAPEVQTNAQVKYLNQNANATVIGSTPDYLSIRNFQIADGRMFTADEVKSYRRVAVIGPTAATNLIGEEPPIGKSIRVRGIQFEVIGVTKSKGTMGGFFDPDDQILIPVTTAMRRVIGTRNVRSISVQARSLAAMDQASSEVDELLRRRHRIPAEREEAFNIRSQGEMIAMVEESNRLFTVLLAGIASVSLLVGGIGIMNIMLVSVTERTREIGLRKALGARRRDIQAQFLVEAIVLSLVGGTIGVLFGLFGSFALGKLLEATMSISLASIVMSFAFAAFVGIFFGFYPAMLASRLDPIDALRYE